MGNWWEYADTPISIIEQQKTHFSSEHCFVKTVCVSIHNKVTGHAITTCQLTMHSAKKGINCDQILKTNLMGIVVDWSYKPKHTLERHTMVFQITTVRKNTILCLLPGTKAMHIWACTCPGEAFLLVHSFCHWLPVMEKCSHDANVTMATIVAQHLSMCYS